MEPRCLHLILGFAIISCVNSMLYFPELQNGIITDSVLLSLGRTEYVSTYKTFSIVPYPQSALLKCLMLTLLLLVRKQALVLRKALHSHLDAETSKE